MIQLYPESEEIITTEKINNLISLLNAALIEKDVQIETLKYQVSHLQASFIQIEKKIDYDVREFEQKILSDPVLKSQYEEFKIACLLMK